jgi:hypothetical protein
MATQRLPKPEAFNARGANLKTLFPGDGASAGNPTIPGIARGLMDGTLIAYTNSRLEHACDFIDELRKNVELKKFIKAAAKYIRQGIRMLLDALGVDATVSFSWIVDTMKAAARELQYIQKEIIQPIIKFEKYVLNYIVRVRKIIAWLASLPARFRALLASCYAKLLRLINGIFTDFFMELTADTGIGEVFAAANELAQAAYDLRASVKVAIGGVGLIQQGLQGIQTDITGAKKQSISENSYITQNYVDTITSSASASASIPMSQSDLDMSNKQVISYQETVTTTLDVSVQNATPKPNKNGP